MLRAEGEKAKAYKTHRLPISDLRHGDIFYDPAGERGSMTWIVCDRGDGKLVAETSTDDSGYVRIPRRVAARIEDPVDFYGGVTDDNLYQGVTSISFDLKVEAHQAIASRVAGGRPVLETRKVRWTTYDGFGIIAPDPPEYPNGRLFVLDAETPDVYLGMP